MGSFGWFLQQTPPALQATRSGSVPMHPVAEVQAISAEAGMMNGLAVNGTTATIAEIMNLANIFFMATPGIGG